jgi:hypothetical protein
MYDYAVQRGLGTLLRILAIWLIVMAYLAGVAYAKRLSWQDRLAARIVSQATPTAEHGKVDWDKYLYGDWSRNSYQPSWQGSAVYLMERGRRYPALERVLLLLEARRTPKFAHPWTRCFNWDLRRELIRRSMKQYPDDLRVAWAAARIYFIAGDYAKAEPLFKRVLDSDLDIKQLGDERPDLLFQRYCACLTMLGRDDEIEQLLRTQAERAAAGNDARFSYLDFLCQRGKYGQVRQLAAAAQRDFPQDPRFAELLERAAWWGGDIAEYRRLLLAKRGPGAASAELPFADARLALLDGDFATANRLLNFPSNDACKAYAEAYAVSRLPEIMARLLERLEQFPPPPEPVADANDPYSGGGYAYDEHAEERARVQAQVLRGYVMAREWAAAARFEAILPEPGYNTYTAGRDTAWLLAAIAQPGPLRVHHLDGLMESGGIVRLVRSEYYADAVRSGGRNRKEVLDWVRLLLRPEREQYNDGGNGFFDPPQ